MYTARGLWANVWYTGACMPIYCFEGMDMLHAYGSSKPSMSVVSARVLCKQVCLYIDKHPKYILSCHVPNSLIGISLDFLPIRNFAAISFLISCFDPVIQPVGMRRSSSLLFRLCLIHALLFKGELAQVVERSLSMREVPGSMPGFSTFIFNLFFYSGNKVQSI